jgi:predicted enzyme related to lactoylglutathione lyase
MSTTKTTGRFIWHELFSPDPKAARAFYTELFGWRSAEVDMGPSGKYTLLKVGDKDVAGAVPADASKQIPAHWNLYFTSRDTDATVKHVERLGGKVYMQPQDIPGVGRFAALADPQGAAFSVLTPSDERAEREGAPGAGEFCWVELLTDDTKGALRFYKDVFGWTSKELAMEGMPAYNELSREGGKGAGGILKKPMEGPNAWLSYVAVDDVDATAKRATSLRGKVVAPPTDIPNIGRFAVIQDPTGAVIAIFKGSAMPK